MTSEAERPTASCAGMPPGAAPAGPRRWRDEAGEHIDVRGLPPPQPLVAILRLVHEQGRGGAAVVVHHDREPALLYPELAEIGWGADRLPAEPGEVRLMLTPRA